MKIGDLRRQLRKYHQDDFVRFTQGGMVIYKKKRLITSTTSPIGLTPEKRDLTLRTKTTIRKKTAR